MTTIISEQTPSQLKTSLSWAYLVLLLILGFFVWWGYATSTSLERLSDPVSAVADSLGPELEFYDGVETSPRWQQVLLIFPGLTQEEFIKVAIKTWRDVITTIQQNPEYYDLTEVQVAQAHLLILLAEKQNWQAAQDELNTWQNTDSPLLQYVISIYGHNQYIERPEHAFFEIYPDNWTTLHVLKQEAKIRGDSQRHEQINNQIQQLTRSQLNRTIAYTLVWWMLTLFGVLLFIVYFRKFLLPANPYQTAWPTNDALGICIRIELILTLLLLMQSVWYVLAEYVEILSPLVDIFYSWMSLFSGLVSVFFIHLFLIRPRATTFRDAFGLSLSRMNGALPLFGWVLVLLSLDNIGIIMINLIADGLGVKPDWSEGISENLLWGTPFEVTLESIDTVIWAPIFEELLFRGVLYLGLRQRYSPIVAALISAALFSLLHFYSIVGFFEVFWSGILYALAFEYSRSLLPAIGAHMLYNLHWLLYSLVFYRL